MSKLKLTLILLFVVILGGLSGAIYYASTLVSPDEVRRLTLEKLEETFPNAEIELGKIEFSMGPTFKFDLEKLAINAPQNNPKKLFAVEDIHVKVPVWAILFGGGEIDVRIQSPELHYTSIEESNNWALAMQKKEKSEETKTEKQTPTEDEGGAAAVVVPGFLANSQLNLRVSDLKTKYQVDEQKGEFEVSKFLIRNLNFEASTAFELDSKLSFQMGPSQKIDFETLIIGQFNLGTYIKKNELPIMAVIKINNFKGPMLSKPLSEIKTDLNLLVKNEEVTGGVELSLLKDVKLSADLMTSDAKTGLSNLNVNIPLSEVISLLDLELENLDMSKATLNATGEVNVLKDGKIVPNIKLTVGPSLTQSFMEQKFSHKLEVSLVKKNFDSKLTSELFTGTMIAKTSAQLDLNQDISIENLPRFSSTVNLTSLSVSEGFIQDAIYSEKDKKEAQEKKESQTEVQAQSEEQTPLIIPPGSLTLTMTNINLGGEILSGDGVFEAQKNFIATKKLDFEYSGGQGKLTHLSKLKDDSLNHQFDFDLKNFSLEGLQPFLPPALGKVSGSFNLQMNGTADTSMASERPAQFDIVVDALGTDGKAQVLVALGDKLNDLLSNVPQLAEKLNTEKPLELDGRFDKLSLKSNLTHKKYEMNKIGFVGPENRFSLEGRGQIFPPVTKKTSVMNFVYRENKGSLVSHLKELTGNNELPFQLTGPGFSMKPNYGHTVEVLAKKAVKTQGEKIIKKEAKKIESKLKDKLDKKSKEKIKDLFGL